MSVKKCIFMTDATVGFIAATTQSAEDAPKWSNAVNSSIEQYRFLLADALPDLDDDEWPPILNTYSGCHMPAHNYTPRVASDMMDDMGEINLDNVTPERASLIKKIHAMSRLEQMAILYFVQIFWLNDWDDIKNFAEIKNTIRGMMLGTKGKK